MQMYLIRYVLKDIFFRGTERTEILNEKIDLFSLTPSRPGVEAITDVSDFDKSEETQLDISSTDKYSEEVTEFFKLINKMKDCMFILNKCKLNVRNKIV